MKRRYLLLIMILIVIMPSKIKAICNDSKVSQMQQYSKDVTYTYTYNEKNDKVTFDITFTNLKNIISIKSPLDNRNYTNKNEVTIKNLKPNEGYTFEIYSVNNCPSTPLKTLYIEMPGYNKYYNDKICEGLEEFKYCQKWINLPFEYNRLQTEVNKYKQKQVDEKQKKKEEKTMLDGLKKFISKLYSTKYLLLLSVIIAACILVMELRDRKSNLD